MSALPADLAIGARGGGPRRRRAVAVEARRTPQVATAAVARRCARPSRAGARVAARIVAVAALLGAGAAVGERAPWASSSLVAAHAFSAGRWATGAWAGLAGLAALPVRRWSPSPSRAAAPCPFIFIPIAAWVAGWTIREREHVAARLAERARELDAEREAYARAVGALRARPDRRRAARHRRPRDQRHGRPGRCRTAPCRRGPRADRRGLRGDRRRGARRPSRTWAGWWPCSATTTPSAQRPDLALVEELVARAAGSGLDVTLRLEGEREGYPVAVVQVAYRVVQEGRDQRACATRPAHRVARDRPRRGARRSRSRSSTAPRDGRRQLAGQRHGQRPARPARAR